MTTNKKKLRRAQRQKQLRMATQSLLLTGLLLAGSAGVAGAAVVAPIDGETFTLADGQELSINGNTPMYVSKNFTMTGGSFSLGSALGGATGAGLMGAAAGSTPLTADFNLSGGTLTVGASPTATGGSQIQMDKVVISGGTINMQGTIGDATDWSHGSKIAASKNFTITGGTFTMGDYAQLELGRSDTTDLDFTISGGTINLNGSTASKAALIHTLEAPRDQQRYVSNLFLNGDTKIVVADGKHGVIASQLIFINGATISVGENASLVVAENLESGKGTIDNAIQPAPNNIGSSFYLNSGTVTVANSGKLDFASGDVRLDIDDTATLHTHQLTLGTAAAATGTSARNVFLNSGGTLTVETLVRGAGGRLDVGSYDGVSKLTVTKQFQTVGSQPSAPTEININRSGMLETKYDLVTTDGTANIIGGTLKVVSGGTVVLTGHAGPLDLANLQALRNNLFTDPRDSNTGLLEVQGATFTTAAPTLAEVRGIQTSGLVVKDTLANLTTADGISAGVQSIIVSDVAANPLSVISNDLRLIGSTTGGQLIDARNAAGEQQDSTVTINRYRLGTLGNFSNTAHATKGTLTGSVALADKSSTLNVLNGDFTITKDIVAAGDEYGQVHLSGAKLQVRNIGAASSAVDTVNVWDGSTLTSTENVFVGFLDIKDNSQMTAQGNMTVSYIRMGQSTLTVAGTLTSTNDIFVDSDDGSGHLSVNTLNLNNVSLLLAPAWKANGYNPAQAAVKTFTGGAINGNLGVGRNSQLTLGTESTAWLDGHITEMGQSNWNANGIDSALGIYAPQTLGSGTAIIVDGTKTSMDPISYTANTANFSNKSLVVINGAMPTGSAALTAGDPTATATIADGAKLRLVDAKANTDYTILTGFDGGVTRNGEGWDKGNLTTNNRLISIDTIASAAGSYVISTKQNSYATVLPHISGEMAGLVEYMVSHGIGGVEHSNAGIRFVSRTLDPTFMPNADHIAPTLEGAAQLAVVGATQGMTLSAATAATSAVTTRTSFSSPLNDKTRTAALNMSEGTVTQDAGLSAGDGLKNGVGLWVMPLYQSNNAWGMKSGDFNTGYTSDLGGVALGADYTFADAFRVGLALNMGGGYAQSHGDFSKTENSFNFWGINLYGGWSQNNFGITADVGYTGNYNKLKQETPSSMQMGDIKSDVNASAISAGLRGEYKFETAAMDIIPHVGVRYTALSTEGYDAKSNGTVFEADASHQNIWTFPIGVTFTKGFESQSGWIFKPQVDLQIIPAAGDVKTKSKIHIPGVDASADLTTRVMDNLTYGGGVGFDVQKDNVSFGLNYTIQASERSTGHGVFGTFRYEF